jgi:hypothetical protein
MDKVELRITEINDGPLEEGDKISMIERLLPKIIENSEDIRVMTPCCMTWFFKNRRFVITKHSR